MPLLIDNREVLSAREAAQIARCTPRYIAKLCTQGSLHGMKLAAGWFIYRDSLDDFLAERALRIAAQHQLLRARRHLEYSRGEIIRP